ncbi:MAG TPA: DUF4249 domain-containing protein [Cytophagales bacterium]|nr:DUF4249 domain-containing protein [Cytophagales bacterium]
MKISSNILEEILRKCSKMGIFWMIAIILSGCVEPIKLSALESEGKLVVEGWITNLPGPYRIRLSRTGLYSLGYEGVNAGVLGAKVFIVDDLGKEVELKETDEMAGYYLTDRSEIKGEVGRTYKVKIVIGDKVYESKPETLLKPVEIDTAYYEFMEESVFKEKGFYVYIDFKDPENEENYYSWTWEEHYKITRCEVLEGGTGRFCCQSYCYVKERCHLCLDIMSDLYNNGNSVNHKSIVRVPFNRRDPAIAKIFQQSISKDAYIFLNYVKQQTNNAGSVFGTPPFSIPGNIFNVNDPNESVYGYFGAKGESTRYIKVIRKFADGPLSDETTPFKNPPEEPKELIWPCAPCEETEFTTLEIPSVDIK